MADSRPPPPTPPRPPPPPPSSSQTKSISSSTTPPQSTTSYRLDTLPPYLSRHLRDSFPELKPATSIPVHTLSQIPALYPTHRRQRHASLLLLLRHHLTISLAKGGLVPEVLLERARVHECLGFAELAVGDAVVVWRVCEGVEEGGDLQGRWDGVGDGVVGEEEGAGEGVVEADGAVEQDGDEGGDEGSDEGSREEGDGEEMEVDEERVRKLKREAAGVIVRCLWAMGVEKVERERWEGVLGELLEGEDLDGEEDGGRWSLWDGEGRGNGLDGAGEGGVGAFALGRCRREVYPWNGYEGDRMSEDALSEINKRLQAASGGRVEVRKSMLPDLVKVERGLEENMSGLNINKASEKVHPGTNAQLGLFATQRLKPGSTLLTERSALTAIRPHDEALCDACAGDLEGIPAEAKKLCPGCGILFCGDECLQIAISTYHTPNLDNEETDEGFPPASAPFCPGSGGEADIANLGRAESSTTPEWDLYFLLVVRALQMAETMDCHPLEIWECKYLWGDFNPAPDLDATDSVGLKKTLPYSLQHHVELPLQWFELLMLSRDENTPYSAKWLQRYDWWVIQTLYAKFRGVADAKLSSWTGKPETASVYPLWCLANHSCEPSVTWEGGGLRRLKVRAARVVQREGDEEWQGVGEGEEVWNHYTDVREGRWRVRRERLEEVLGGWCRCSRCVREEAEEEQGSGGGSG